MNPEDEGTIPAGNVTISSNQKNTQRMENDEPLGSGATMASVLYANINHPEWKTEYPGIFYYVIKYIYIYIYLDQV